jgi:hypothetical protein
MGLTVDSVGGEQLYCASDKHDISFVKNACIKICEIIFK